MIYINAIELINLCIEHDILKEENGEVPVYRQGTPKSKEGWYLTDKDTLAKELMNDEDGQNMLISVLKEKNVEFKPSHFDFELFDKFCNVFSSNK
ncbi:MAG: hypothetical protein K0R54_804 [Clostridiaceae bacterium]|jgi:hypothetical protein|nr:hypothetical protein [Clostridiaceae bacterium]